MKMKLKVFVVLALSISMDIDNCQAQKQTATHSGKCMSELKEVVDNEKKQTQQLLSAGKAWHMNFTFQALAKVPSDNEYTKVNTKGQMIATLKYKYVKEDQYEIFMDDKDVFTVNNSDKSVMRTASSKQAVTASPTNQYFDLQNDSLVKQYSFNTCNEVYDSLLKMKLVCYTVFPVNKDKAIYSQVRIYVDKNMKMIKKIQVWHNTQIIRDMQTCTVIINSNGEVQSTKVKLPVKDMFLASDGRLRSPYHNYKYKDLKN